MSEKSQEDAEIADTRGKSYDYSQDQEDQVIEKSKHEFKKTITREIIDDLCDEPADQPQSSFAFMAQAPVSTE